MLTIIATSKDNATIAMWIAALCFLLSLVWSVMQPRPRNTAHIFISLGLLMFTVAFIILQGVKLT